MFSELIIFLTAAAPIFELRGAIPLAIGVYHFSPFYSFFLSVLGSIAPVIFLLLFLEKCSSFLMRRNKFCQKILTWWFEKIRKENLKNFEKWKKFALIILAATPIPFIGGSWTAALVAFIFRVSFWPAFFSISIGTIIAGIIVTLVSIGIF